MFNKYLNIGNVHWPEIPKSRCSDSPKTENKSNRKKETTKFNNRKFKILNPIYSVNFRLSKIAYEILKGSASNQPMGCSTPQTYDLCSPALSIHHHYLLPYIWTITWIDSSIWPQRSSVLSFSHTRTNKIWTTHLYRVSKNVHFQFQILIRELAGKNHLSVITPH
jgi:hypothetical protein